MSRLLPGYLLCAEPSKNAPYPWNPPLCRGIVGKSVHYARRYGPIGPEMEAIVVKILNSNLRTGEALHLARTSIITKMKMKAF